MKPATRILTYSISEHDARLRIEQFLRRRGFSGQNLTDLRKIPGSVCVNQTPCILKTVLQPKDILTVTITTTSSSPNILPVPIPFDLVYEDEDLLVVNKPAGMPVHPSAKNHDNTLANALAWYYQEQGLPFVFHCTNRLDRDTSGLVLVARHSYSATRIAQMTKNREIHREYRAIVRGIPAPSEGTIDAPLGRKAGSIIERTVDFEQGEPAITHYQVVESKNSHSLLALQLETGRTHQIRIHLKHLGYPLVGDYLYNPDMEFINRQALHAYHLRFSHPVTGEKMEFTAPLPEDMKAILV
ncbi:putative RNA pseudouridine synthase YjbO [Mediterraneibacter butyricigenes]|uniref:Pseudouridine synthase n=1 Tax=Mediterraneibacter butyricigenes TaxID=2316025 RepID=A0A391NZ77_9FIRM|nr:RluA family pseudouridine synthase [Mediterraneibacter butyricigenes]GCA66521.1 putative RNA pseudouridine synthase YjbO [Mediterraneibacter butyricigenes]